MKITIGGILVFILIAWIVVGIVRWSLKDTDYVKQGKIQSQEQDYKNQHNDVPDPPQDER